MNLFSGLIKGVFWVLLGVTPIVAYDVYDRVIELEVEFEIKQLDEVSTEVIGYYEFDSGMIYIDSDIASSGLTVLRTFSHEIVHKVRYENGYRESRKIEERFAIFLEKYCAKTLGLGDLTTNEYSNWKKQARHDGFDPKMTEEELEIYDSQVEHTKELIKKLLDNLP